MDLSKIARGLKVASALMEDEGRITPDVILDGFFSGRFSDTKKYFESIHSLIEMNQRDFPDLAQRELVTFPSGKNILQGYLYHKENPKGLILYVHGLKGMADDQYAMGIHEFLVRGYSVFAFDLTCSGRSSGLSIPGLQQSAIDVAAARSYLSQRPDLASFDCFGFGHSWGAYGVSASLGLGASFQALCACAGFTSPLEEMLAAPAFYVGSIVETNKDQLEEAIRKRDPLYYNLSASSSLENSTVPCLIVQGDNDRTVPLLRSSIYGALSYRKQPHVSLLLQKGKGHMDLLFDTYSYQYREKIEEMAKPLKKQFGKKISGWPEEEVKRFQSSFSKPMCGVANASLFDEADAFFTSFHS